MSLIGFTDAEMDVLYALASALPPPARDDFLQLVASRLAGFPEEVRGPGLVHRVAAEVQRGFRNVAIGTSGKYGR